MQSAKGVKVRARFLDEYDVLILQDIVAYCLAIHVLVEVTVSDKFSSLQVQELARTLHPVDTRCSR